MKTEEDEAFDDLAKKQGDWGSGFKAKQAMAADKLQEPVTEREALKLAEIIEHFDSNDESLPLELLKEIAATLRALAQSAQEPVIKQGWDVDTLLDKPVQREWVGLTAEETSGFTSHEMTVVKYVSKVLQEKNHG